jgi:hypothetical protein
MLEMIDDVDRLVERVKTARLNKEVHYFFPFYFFPPKKRRERRDVSYVIDDQSTE